MIPRIVMPDNSKVRSGHNKNKTENRKTQPNESKHIKAVQEAMTSQKENVFYTSKKSLPKTQKHAFIEQGKKTELKRMTAEEEGKTPQEIRKKAGLTHVRLQKEEREDLNIWPSLPPRS